MKRIYKFGEFYLETNSRNLLYHEKLIRLSPRAFDILLYLIENQGKVVKKDELLEAVWNDSFVEENNLPVHISALRRVLKERESGTKYIETVSGLGYCFLMPVQKTTSDIFSALSINHSFESNEINSIAILPFVNKINDPSLDYLAEGITESVISNISQLSQLKVMAYSAVSKYKGETINLQETAFILGVNKILQGKIIKFGETLEISVELINGDDLTQIWGEQYEFEPEDLFKLKKEISHKIVESLKLKLTKTETTKLDKQYTSSTTAYKLYLQGRHLMDARTELNLFKSIEYFEQSLKIDPNFALAYTGIADAYNFLGNFYFLSANEVIPQIESAINMAFTLDKNLSEAYSSLGFFHLFYDYNPNKAKEALELALELNQNNPRAHHNYSICFLNFRDLEKSLFHQYKALELDPLSLMFNTTLTTRFMLLGDYTKTITCGEEILSLYPENAYCFYYIAFAHAKKGKLDKAREYIDKAVSLSSSLHILSVKGYILSLFEEENEAREILDKLISISHTKPIDFMDIASIYSALDEPEKAFEYLEKAREARMNHFCILKVDPRFDNLRSDPRFDEFLKKIGL